MKLKDILIELALNKGEWQMVPHEEIAQYEQTLLDLINTAYKGIGGNPNFKTTKDIENPKNDYEVVDVDGDTEVDAASISKKTHAGIKLVATAHDGSNEAKKAIIMHKIDLLKTSGYFAEVSGKLKEILIHKGIPIIMDKDIVEKALAGKKITWHGDGTYDREIAGQIFTKTMVGKPKVG
jgi:hypothetical protein